MRSRANSIGLRRAALFVALAGAVAAIVVVAGRELGWGGPAARGQTAQQQAAAEQTTQQQAAPEQTTQGQGGPAMTLSLSAAPICETERGTGYSGSELRDNDDGSTERYSVFIGYFGIAETDVSWSVSGGTAPYTLEIDGETRDATHSYTGATGTASVSCALDPGETFIDPRDGRGYLSDPPKVDSGVKTIRATVTDADGATAEAALDIYVILNIGDGGTKLERGKTYRIHGFLMTIPDGVDMEIGGYEESDCTGDDCEDAFEIFASGDGYRASLWIGARTGKARSRYIRIDDRARSADEASSLTEEQIIGVLDDLASLASSIGQAPQERAAQKQAATEQTTQGQGETGMTLSLSAAPTCETGRGLDYADQVGLAKTDVHWSVSGGTGPYRFEIDGEMRGAWRYHQGAGGIASVSCALDSGVKTIRASVTDADGAKAEAAIDIYVILNVSGGGIKLERGKTYRVHGLLMTIPDDVDMETGGYIISGCAGEDCEDAFSILAFGDGYEAGIIFGVSTGKAGQRSIWIDDRARSADEAPPPTEEQIIGVLDDLASLASSIGQAPQIDRD